MRQDFYEENKGVRSYDRYQNYTEKKYNRKSLSWFFMKKQADKVILPYVEKIRNKKIIEVGLGFGYYTKFLLKNDNAVIGVDINPELGQNIGIEIIRGCANQLMEKVEDKFDFVLSFFMTEYLSEKEIEEFVNQGIELLNPQGIFMSTVIINRGLGWLYILLARMKGIHKYYYSEEKIRKMVKEPNEMSIIPLPTICHIPFAFLVKVEKQLPFNIGNERA